MRSVNLRILLQPGRQPREDVAQRQHPPILIAARYADACNIPPSPDLPQKLDVLCRLCEQEGCAFDAIEKTAPFGFDLGENGEKLDELMGQLRWLAGMGVETVLGWVVGVDRITPLDIMAREVIPAAAVL